MTLRRDVSLLLSQGHIHAGRYPLWRLQLEAELANQRINLAFATQAALTKSAIDSALSNDALAQFAETLKNLTPE